MTADSTAIVNLEAIEAAAARLRGVAVETPLVRSFELEALAGGTV